MKQLFTLTTALLCLVGFVYGQSLPAGDHSTVTAAVETYIRDNEQKHIQELIEFVSIPCISSLPAHKEDMNRAAQWLRSKLQAIGMSTAEVMPTEGHPVVFSEWNKAKGKPTVLIYGHYDVQPVQEAAWTSPPFQPKVENGRIYGRGASDDKGSVAIAIWSVEGMLQKEGKLPVNVKFLFEGEEENGSGHLEKFVAGHKELLRADDAYSADAVQKSDTQPAMTISAKGEGVSELLIPC